MILEDRGGLSPEAELVDENLHAALRVFGEASGKGRVAVSPHLTMISSGLPYGVFNLALARGKSLDAHAMVDMVHEAERFFRQEELQWSLWVSEERLKPDQRYGYVALLARHKLGFLTSAPGMIADVLREPVRALPEMEIRKVEDAVTRREFAFLVSTCFEIPGQFAEMIYGQESAWKGAYQGYLGYVGGRAVSCIAIAETPGAVGVYTLGTPLQWRRRGYGERLLRALVEPRLREEAGTRTILQSSEAGLALYRRMGYRQVSRYGVFLVR